MNKSLWVKLAISFVLVTSMSLSSIQSIDDSGNQALHESRDRALVAFGVARALNAGISMLQGTQFSVAPMGVGVTMTIGEVLDPVNDIVERISWVMLASTTSIFIQEVFMAMLTTGVFVTFFKGILLLTLLVTWLSMSPPRVKAFLVKVSLLLVFLRFTVPIVFALNGAVYAEFLKEDFKEASIKIEGLEEKIIEVRKDMLGLNGEMLSTTSMHDQEKEGLDKSMEGQGNENEEKDKSFLKKASEQVALVLQKGKEKISGIPETLNQLKNYSMATEAKSYIKKRTEAVIEKVTQYGKDIAQYMITYSAVFVLNTVIFPIVFLYAFYRLCKHLMTLNLMPLFNE